MRRKEGRKRTPPQLPLPSDPAWVPSSLETLPLLSGVFSLPFLGWMWSPSVERIGEVVLISFQWPCLCRWCTHTFLGLQNHCRWWLQPWNQRTLTPWKESYDRPRQHIKKQRHYFANKGPSNQGYGFSSSHVWMWELDYKESWAPKNWCFWTIVLEKSFESPLDCKEISPECLLEGLMLKLKLQYFATWCEELTHLKGPWCWERLKAGG